MKKYISIISISGLLVLFSGCTDWLDLKPESEVVLDDFWKSESDATEVAIACYRSLIEEASMHRMIVWGEARSDNTEQGNSTNNDLVRVLNEEITSTNGYANWASIYQTINYCNTFLYFAPGVIDQDVNFTQGKYQALESEVLAIRALCYFYLVRAYKEVPLILEPSIDDTQDYFPAKSSERQILDQIIADLLKAEKSARTNFLGESYPKARVTKNMIRTLLADIYLWDQQYENCIAMCDLVVADENLELEDAETMLQRLFFYGTSSEIIFSLPFDDDVLRNLAVRALYGSISNQRGQLFFPVFMAESINSPFNFSVGSGKESVDDYRFNMSVDASNKTLAEYYIFKYVGLYISVNQVTNTVSRAYTNISSNWVVYRLADVILMKAEALVALNRSENDLKEALTLVNTTYLRSNFGEDADSLSFSSYASAAQMEELVLRERQRELLFEGKRWFDLVRLARRDNSTTRVKGFVTLKKSTSSQSQSTVKLSVLDALYWPVPQSEIDGNKNLVQNPYYELSSTN
ncbi:MAG: RagB/SusD family nutrient uptake outer membrane protein [Breznakibacter sp.]